MDGQGVPKHTWQQHYNISYHASHVGMRGGYIGDAMITSCFFRTSFASVCNTTPEHLMTVDPDEAGEQVDH